GSRSRGVNYILNETAKTQAAKLPGCISQGDDATLHPCKGYSKYLGGDPTRRKNFPR
ncbi:hypothetical protein U1Q18_050990, partial [Sarracenia purpurea var. burkii]